MGNRKHSKIDKLPPTLKETVEQMLLTGSTYREVAGYLEQQGIGISLSAICNYARNLNATVQMINIANQNFERVLSEMEKYPNMDTSEVIIRLASQNMVTALINTDEDAWSKVSPEKLLAQANGLVNAAASKQRADLQAQSVKDTALDEVKGMVFAALKKERPELYGEVVKFLNEKREE